MLELDGLPDNDRRITPIENFIPIGCKKSRSALS
ncbi:hypothetical protein SAMN04490185_4735 [Pseudomonas frederiksbergensis]|uniref:Uncharacterized protein n=1 Tax=Pseudomonas frederiksbergensis TaxID=104087 RepID=A0A1H5FCX2_9PSED|nr:hypothetical protein SAMN04490185_4735 [Pseudomonas frederiksbergensis]